MPRRRVRAVFTATAIGRASSVVLLAVLNGCATPPPPIPADLQYRAPQAAEGAATIVGTQRDLPLIDNITAFASSIDKKCVMNGRAGWNVPLTLSPGRHKIVIKFVQGAHEAFASLVLDAQAGHAYQIRYLDGGGVIIGPGTHMDFWIVDAQSGTTVTDVVRRGISTNREETRLCDELFRVID